MTLEIAAKGRKGRKRKDILRSFAVNHLYQESSGCEPMLPKRLCNIEESLGWRLFWL